MDYIDPPDCLQKMQYTGVSAAAQVLMIQPPMHFMLKQHVFNMAGEGAAQAEEGK